uniref:ShKT domain-containing protein n=1 Tax=Caenorhabditis japonica TaxID=281687 RepID=A0A8R1HSZ0_CAEJA
MSEFQSISRKFQVLRAHAADISQLAALRDIHAKTQHDLDFWQTPSKVGHRADIMVDEDRIEWLDTVLKNSNISYDVIIQDVEKLILEKEHNPKKLSSLMFSKRMHNEGGNRARYPWGEYHSYQKIIDWMRDIEQKYPTRAKMFTMGRTEEGRPIQGIKIGSQVWRTDKRVFWIDGGIHAREWAAVHTTLWFIDRLIADYDDDALVRNAVDRLNFYILPVANPDGYEYSRSDVSPMIRLWRKNRAGVVCKKDRWFRDRCCGGVDLNRNYDWHFGETGSSTDKCSEIYQGSSAFSELESRSMRDFLTSPELNGKVDAFITLHTYSQMWIHPYSHARKAVPNDIAELQRVGRAAVSALENTFGTKYKFGTGSDILYPSSGGSDDWAKGALHIKYVYLLELRPGEDVWDGFILDQHQLIPTAKETWNGIKVVIKAATDHALFEPIASIETPTTTTTTTATTMAPWMTTTTTTTSSTTTTTTAAPTTTIATTPVPFSSIFIVTEPSTQSTSTPAHFDAFYKLGKRRFKFVSIRTFRPLTPTTPSALLIESEQIADSDSEPISSSPSQLSFVQPIVTVVDGPALSSDENELEFEGGRQLLPSRVPAFVRRPSANRLRTSTNARRPGVGQQQQFVQRPARPFRNRSQNGSGQVQNVMAQRTLPPQSRCSDRSAWCASWLAANSRVCQISSIYMRQDCARTCGFCR